MDSRPSGARRLALGGARRKAVQSLTSETAVLARIDQLKWAREPLPHAPDYAAAHPQRLPPSSSLPTPPTITTTHSEARASAPSVAKEPAARAPSTSAICSAADAAPQSLSLERVGFHALGI